MDDILLLTFIFLVAGVVAVAAATRLGLGSVLGYLLAGMLISPLLSALGVDVVSVQHFAEFGVVMMLFLVGLELEPRLLWEMRDRLLGMGGMQVAGSALLVMAVAMVLGQPWQTALAVGLILALSSTAIVLQTLNERGLLRSDGGQASFAVLLFQDIAVIPMLAFIPLLAIADPAWVGGLDGGMGAEASGAAPADAGAGGHDGAGHPQAIPGDGAHPDSSHGADLNLVAHLPPWAGGLVTLAAIGAVIFMGSVLSRPLLRAVARTGLRELFTAAALMIVIGVALLMTLVGLSPALGAFIAGVVLANSEYRHELESDIDPFRGLLLGLFFITVGAGIDFSLLLDQFPMLAAMTLGLMAAKFAVLLTLGTVFRIRGQHRWLLAMGLAQAGEFGFVLLAFTEQTGVLAAGLTAPLGLVVAMSMLLTPLLFIVYDRLVAPRFSRSQTREADAIEERRPVIIAGRGRVGGIVDRMLRAAGYETTCIDYNSQHLEVVRTFGVKLYFGDATRPDLLRAAGIDEAALIVVAIDDKEQINQLVRYLLRHHPQVHVMARAVDRDHVYELYEIGCRDIIRETYDSSIRMGRSAFEALGIPTPHARAMARAFDEMDRRSMRSMAEVYQTGVPPHLNAAYVARMKAIRGPWEEELGRRMAEIRAGSVETAGVASDLTPRESPLEG